MLALFSFPKKQDHTIIFSLLPIKHLSTSSQSNNGRFECGKKEKIWTILNVVSLMLKQSRNLILLPVQMSTGSIPQSCPTLPEQSAEVARQIPYTMLYALSILDFLRIDLIY